MHAVHFLLCLAALWQLSGQHQPLVSGFEQALAQGRMENARALLAQILERPRLEPDVLLRMGVRLAERDMYAEAARVFARSVRDYPARFEAHYNLALADFALGNFPAALAALDAAPRGAPEDELARRYLRGKIYAVLQQPVKAEQDLAAAFDRAPRQENFALDLGLFYLRQRTYDRAAAVFERGSAANPRSPFLRLGLALAQLLGGRQAQSVQTSEMLLRFEPGFAPARLLMAFALYSAGEFERCEKAAREGLAAAQPHPYLYYLHSAVLLKLQSTDYDRILRELETASRAIPGCSLCYVARSKAHQELGDTDAAIVDLETITGRIDPGFSQAWYRLAPLYERTGRPQDAARARQRFRAIKAEADHDNEMIRDLFLPALDAGGRP